MTKDVIGPAAQWPTVLSILLWSQNLSPYTTIWAHYGHSALLARIFFYSKRVKNTCKENR